MDREFGEELLRDPEWLPEEQVVELDQFIVGEPVEDKRPTKKAKKVINKKYFWSRQEKLFLLQTVKSSATYCVRRFGKGNPGPLAMEEKGQAGKMWPVWSPTAQEDGFLLFPATTT